MLGDGPAGAMSSLLVAEGMAIREFRAESPIQEESGCSCRFGADNLP